MTKECNSEVESSWGGKEVKREGKGWRKSNCRCVRIKWEEKESSYKKEKMIKEV